MLFKDQIEKNLIGVWQKLLGNVEIKYNDNFFLLGGDEFLFSALNNYVSQAYGIDFSSDTFQDLHLFYQQVELLDRKLGIYRNNFIIPLNEERGSPLLVFVHPLGGTVFSYKKIISRLNIKLPVLAVQDRFLVGKIQPYASLKEQAKYYVDSLRSFSPRELILLGHSSGGTIAFEMANQFLSLGYTIKHIVMFDSWIDIPFSVKTRNFFQSIMLRQLDRLKPDLFFNQQFKLNDWLEILWQRMEILMQYVPERIAVDATLFVPTESVEEYKITDDSIDRWRHSIKKLNVISVPGNHETMLDDRFLTIIIDHLKLLLSSYLKE